MLKAPLAVRVGAVVAALTAAPAMSQVALEEIVVTAQKRDQSLQEVPLAISAIGSEDIERVNAQDMKDLQFSTPNLVVSGANSALQFFGIRGISDVSRNPGYDNRVGVYVDGVWVGRSTAANQAALDIQGVEILRGPQGTLFGKNTVAGALNITTKRPGDELGGSLGVEAGNYNLLRTTGTLDLPLSDNLRSKISFSQTRKDGHIEDVLTGRDFEDKDELAVRGQLEWDVNDSTQVYVSVDDVKNEFSATLGENVHDVLAPDLYEVALDGQQSMKTESKGSSLQISHTFANDFELVSITGKRSGGWTSIDNDEDYSPASYAAASASEKSEHLSQEFRLASPEYDNFDYVLGLYYLDQNIKGTNDATAFAPVLAPTAPPVYLSASVESEVEVESFAAFAHGNYDLSDKLQLTAGLRFTKETKEIDYVSRDQTGLFSNAAVKDDRSISNWSPKLSLNWFLNEDLMVYGSYSKAYKSGGWNADTVADPTAMAFDDEEVDSFEVGMKSTLADGRVRFNLVGYHAEYSDFQVFSFVPLDTGGTQITVTNAGEVTSQGIEMDLQWMISDNWRLWSAYGYTDSTYDEFKNGGGEGIHYDGNSTSYAPKNNFNVGAEYSQMVSAGVVTASLDYVYRSESFSNPNNLSVNQMESLEQVNGRIGFESGSDRWSVYLWGKNLTDENQAVTSSVSFMGIQRAVYNMPRTYGISVKYNFGG